MKKLIITCLVALLAIFACYADTPILGYAVVDADVACRFVQSHNPNFDPEIALQYIQVGDLYGVRGDIALCQAILETGWFTYVNGTAVVAEDHNYCGLGVMKQGTTGCAFPTVRDGVTAHIQHLYAYACSDDLPWGNPVVDPRFKYVTRSCAPTWEQLVGRWAADPNYSSRILNLYERLKKFTAAQ
jgi:hypothetical protein